MGSDPGELDRASRRFALLPIAVLALSTLWSGTFPGAASSLGFAASALGLLGFALVGASSWRDPLGLGSLLPMMLVVAILGSWAASPVPRAGLEAVVLLPAWLLLPAGVAACWRTVAARRTGSAGLALLVAVVSVWGLSGALLETAGERALPPPALPLGHHNLLAAWLVGALPLAAVALGRVAGWSRGAVAVVPLALATVLLTGSLGAALALVVQGGLLLLRPLPGRRRLWLQLLILAVALTQLPRLASIAAAADLSSRLRLLYAAAGWRGFTERPLLGWGPGSSRWLLAETLHPDPGISPAGEVVTDLHSLPLHLLFELGLTGFVLVLLAAALFVRDRWWRRRAELDPMTRAAGLGLCGLAVSSLVGRVTAAPALVVLAGALAGVALAHHSPPADPARRRAAMRWPVVVYVAGALLLLRAPSSAHRHYEQAIANAAVARAELEAAVRLDSAMPLYAARLAWLSAGESGQPSGSGAMAGADRTAAADRALAAAEAARGLGPLWLLAGLLGQEAGAVWTTPALIRACELDPLGAAAPLYLAFESTDDGEAAAVYAARALLADPRLAAAVYWDEKVGLYAAAVRRIAAWRGLEPAFKSQLLQEFRTLLRARRQRRSSGGNRIVWTLELDGEPSTSLSLHAFRRPAWRTRLGYVELRAEALAQIIVPSAAAISATDAAAFPRSQCRAPEPATAPARGRARDGAAPRPPALR